MIKKLLTLTGLALCSIPVYGQLISEDFSSATGTTPPTGWTNNDLNSSGEVWRFSNPGSRTLNAPIAGNAAIFDSDDYGSGGAEDAALESPTFDASAGGFYLLSFDHYFQTGFGGAYAVEVYDGTAWDTVLQGSANSTANPQSEVIDITSAANGYTAAQVRFHWTGDWSWYWIVDNVVVENVNCLPPTNLGVTALTSTSADVYWTPGNASDWEIEYGPSGFALGSGTRVAATNDTTTISGLSNLQVYDVYVRDSCGVGSVSAWNGPFTFGLNHTCATAASITANGSYTAAPPAIIGGCENCGSAANATWFSFTPTSNGTITVSACGNAKPDTRMFIYDGSCGSLNQVASDDDGCPSPSSTASEVSGLQVNSGITYYIEFDDRWSSAGFDFNFTFTAVSCLAPTALGATNITSTTADLYWTAGQASDFNLVVDTPGFSPSTGTLLSAANDTFNVSSLSPNTTYDFYVRDSCAAGNVSSWTGPFSFTTECVDQIAPYTMDFETSTTNLPTCWSSFSSTGEEWEFVSSNLGHSASTGADGTTYFAAFDDSESPSTSDGTLLSPNVDISALTSPELAFYLWSDAEDSSGVSAGGVANATITVDIWDGSTWTQEFTNTGNTTGWELIIIDLSSYSSASTIRARFIVDEDHDGGFDDDISIDEIQFREEPACSDPTALALDSASQSSITVSWTSSATTTSSYVEYGPVGFTPGTGTVVSGAVSPQLITGLQSNTAYQVCVTDSCVTDTSGTVCAVFRTDCGYQSLPYVESFDNNSSTISCWSGTAWALDTSVSGYGVGDNSLLMPFYSLQTGTFDLQSAKFNDAPSNYQLSFDHAYATFTTEEDSLEILYSVDSGQTFTSLVTLLGGPNGPLNTGGQSSGPFAPTASQWATFNINLPTGSNQVLFRAYTAYGNNLYVDNVAIEPLPSCADPSDLTVSNVGSDNAAFTWTSGGAANFEIEYGPIGFTQGNGTVVSGSGSSYTLSGLSATTCYDVYLRDDCGANGFSSWIGPVNFCTQSNCGIIAPPFIPNDTICSPGLIAFSPVSTADDFVWYNAGSDTIIAIGNTFADSIGQNTDYEASSVTVQGNSLNIGPSISISSNVYPTANFSNGQYITVYDTVRIDSTTFMTTGAAAGFTAIQDSAGGTILQLSKPWSIAGADTAAVELGLVLTPGSYFMRNYVTSGTGVLYRSTSGAVYPYGYPGLMTIDSVNFPGARYYYFYEMKVSAACLSDKRLFTGVVNSQSFAGVNVSDTVCDTLGAVDLTLYLDANADQGGTFSDVSSTGALSGSTFDLNAVANNATYDFNYIVVGSAGCPGDTATISLYVDDCTIGLSEHNLGLNVYPTVTGDKVFIENKGTLAGSYQLELYSIEGRLLMSGEYDALDKVELNLGNYADGVYNIRIVQDERMQNQRVIKR